MTEPASPSRPPSTWGTILPITLGVLLWLALWFQILVLSTLLKRRYDEFGLQLPELTRTVMTVGSWAGSAWRLVIPAVLGLAVGSAGALGYARSRPGLARLAIILAWLAIAGLTAFNLIVLNSLLLPELKLQQGLRK